MNEPTEPTPEAIDAQNNREAREFLDAHEARTTREQIQKLHRTDEPTTEEATARLYQQMGEKAPAADVHFEVGPDNPLPIRPMATEEQKIMAANNLIDNPEDPDQMVKFLQDAA